MDFSGIDYYLVSSHFIFFASLDFELFSLPFCQRHSSTLKWLLSRYSIHFEPIRKRANGKTWAPSRSQHGHSTLKARHRTASRTARHTPTTVTLRTSNLNQSDSAPMKMLKLHHDHGAYIVFSHTKLVLINVLYRFRWIKGVHFISQMNKGYIPQALQLNETLHRYERDPRYDDLFIDLVNRS